MRTPDGGRLPLRTARGRRRHLPWEDHQLGRGIERPGFLEEAERRARRHFDLLEAVQAPALGKKPVGHLGGLARATGDAALVLDFNFAYNPACAFSPHYNCPVPPPENRLVVAIRAGEMTPES